MTTGTRKTRMLGAGLLSLAFATGLAACGGDGGGGQPEAGQEAGAGGTTVQIKQFRFQPDKLEVSRGTTVTWRNEDAILHTVTAGAPGQPKGSFDKELADKGTAASVTFDSPGTFTYFCSRHPEAMRAEITVKG